VVSTLAQCYVDRAATGVGAVAEMADERKLAKYSNLASNFTFQPIAVENPGSFSLSTLEFLSDLGHKLSSFSGEERASSFLFQRVSVSLQRFNSCSTARHFRDRQRSRPIVTPALILTFLLLTIENYTRKDINKNNNNNIKFI